MATITGFTITIIGLILVYRQILTSIKDRETDTLIRLYEISTREPLYSDFDKVWCLVEQTNLTIEDEASCLRACLFFEMVGAISSQRYIDTLLIEEYFGSLVTGCYKSLQWYIFNQRSKPYNDKFAINFERLVNSLERSSRISRDKSKNTPPEIIDSSRWTGRS